MMQPIQFADFSGTELEHPVSPDLLRRFVALPLRGAMTWQGLHFDIQTNDARILDSLESSEAPQGPRIIRLNIFVDPDLPQASDMQPIIMTDESLCWAHSSSGLFAFDREAGEIFVFLAESAADHWMTAFHEILQAWQELMPVAEKESLTVVRPYWLEFI